MKAWEVMNVIVKRHIEENGIKQKFLAEKCGYTEKAFSLMINGKKNITDADIEKFCIGMNVSPSKVIIVKLNDNFSTSAMSNI